MEAPAQIEPRGLADYLEVMSKAVFQPGMSWRVVNSKWPGIRDAFHDFDPVAVAGLGEDDMDRLTSDTRVIRNRRKLDAVVHNARQMLDLQERHGSFRHYLRSHGSFDATVADMRKRFKFLGEAGAYYFLWVVREDVPPYDEWCATRGQAPHGQH